MKTHTAKLTLPVLCAFFMVHSQTDALKDLYDALEEKRSDTELIELIKKIKPEKFVQEDKNKVEKPLEIITQKASLPVLKAVLERLPKDKIDGADASKAIHDAISYSLTRKDNKRASALIAIAGKATLAIEKDTFFNLINEALLWGQSNIAIALINRATALGLTINDILNEYIIKDAISQGYEDVIAAILERNPDIKYIINKENNAFDNAYEQDKIAIAGKLIDYVLKKNIPLSKLSAKGAAIFTMVIKKPAFVQEVLRGIKANPTKEQCQFLTQNRKLLYNLLFDAMYTFKEKEQQTTQKNLDDFIAIAKMCNLSLKDIDPDKKALTMAEKNFLNRNANKISRMAEDEKKKEEARKRKEEEKKKKLEDEKKRKEEEEKLSKIIDKIKQNMKQIQEKEMAQQALENLARALQAINK